MIKILVIDDEEIIRNRLKDLLILDGYETFSAANGNEGIELFQKVWPSLVVVDLRMPGMDGLEVLRKIREIERNAKIIIMTGHGGIECASEALDNGAINYLQKPLVYDELIREIKKIETTL